MRKSGHSPIMAPILWRLTMCKPLTTVALTTGMLLGLTYAGEARAPVRSGNTACVGEIERTLYANDGYYDVFGSNDACSFDGHTAEGRKILVTCPVGSRCRIEA